MSTTAPWLQSDRHLNVQFRRRWAEPAWVLRLDAIREKTPPRPPHKERPAPVVGTSNRPLIKIITTTADYSRRQNNSEARHAAEALFAARPP
jgi:hypothetical protein